MVRAASNSPQHTPITRLTHSLNFKPSLHFSLDVAMTTYLPGLARTVRQAGARAIDHRRRRLQGQADDEVA